MKQISYEEWQRAFETRLKEGVELDEDPEALTFFDTGAVQNSEGDFVIKLDQIQ